jgi:hypothetical protein
MKILLSFTLLLILQNSGLQAQDSYIKERLNIKIAYCTYPWMGDISYDNPAPKKPKPITPAGIIEVNYGLLNFIETGLYLGFSFYERVNFEKLEAAVNNKVSFPIYVDKTMKPMFFYGANVNLQLLPLVTKSNKFIFDLYISSKLGCIYFVDKNYSDFSRKRSQIDYGIYGGIALHPFKHFGLYYEYGYGNYVKWKTGVSMTF